MCNTRWIGDIDVAADHQTHLQFATAKQHDLIVLFNQCGYSLSITLRGIDPNRAIWLPPYEQYRFHRSRWSHAQIDPTGDEIGSLLWGVE